MTKESQTAWYTFALDSAPEGLLALEFFRSRTGIQDGDLVHSYAASLHFENLARSIEQPPLKSFEVQRGHEELHYQILRNYGIIQISLSGPRVSTADLTFDAFLQHPSFIMSWIVSDEFERWQNARDPQEYEDNGRDSSSLRLIPSGLPPPLDFMRIDISGNPGRRIIRQGYIEAVGSVMYLGPRFWAAAGSDPQPLMTCNRFVLRWISPSVLEVHAAAEPFCSADAESRQIQEDLRRLLYPRTPSDGG